MEDDFLEMQYEDLHDDGGFLDIDFDTWEYPEEEFEDSVEWTLCEECDEHYNYCQCDD